MRSWPRPTPLAIEWWLIAIIASALVLLLAYDRTTRRTDTFVYDLLLGLESREPDPRIFLVSIDGRSLAELGPWPWPRDLQARLVESIAAANPAAVAYDVLLLEPTEPARDAALARAIERPPPVFLPLLIESPGLNGTHHQAVLPLPEFRDSAAALGHVNLIADPDGVFRRVRVWDGDHAKPWPHLMELMRRIAAPDTIGTAAKANAAPLLVPFTGRPGNFPSVDAAAVLRGEVPDDVLRNRLIIVGATAEGLGDRYPTSYGRGGAIMSGVEFQGNILDGLLSNRMISEGGFAARAALALVPLWLLLLAFRFLPPRTTAWLLAALLVGVVGVTAGSLFLSRIWVPPMTAVAGLAIVYPLWGWRRLAAVSGQMLRQLERLHAQPDALAPAGRAVRGVDPVTRQTLLLNEAIERLQTLQRFVSDSLHQLPDTIFVADEQGEMLLANTQAERLLASLDIRNAKPNARELLARLIPDGDSEQVLLEWPPEEDDASGGVGTSDGRHFALRIAPRHAADGRRLGWIIQLSNDSEVWLSRHQREEMMHFLSHDMRSPQASILAALSTAREKEIDRDLAGRIESYARRTLNLADGIVQLARAEMLQYRMEPVDLSDVLIDATDELWPQAVARGIKIETSGEESEWIVGGERSLLTRAVLNLIDNAIKFSPDRSVVRCEIAPRTTSGEKRVACAVTDTGSGIHADQLCSLFERFKRSPQASGRKGIGLGLAFVQAVATRHGGSIHCTSEPDQGSTFTLSLPLLDQGPGS